jgi:class 3 adenylate cyclase
MQILLSDATYAAVRDYVVVNELEPIQVKGRTQYTKAYELVRIG